MLSPVAVLAIAVGLFSTLGAGCAISPPAADVLSEAVAPAQSERPDPNAPYMIPAQPRPVSASATSATVVQAPPCAPDALKVEEIAGNVRDNYHSIKVGFQNQAGVACELSGYPLVALFNGQGQSLGSIAVQRTTEAEVHAELAEAPAGRANSPAPPKSASADNAPAQVVLMPKQVAAFQMVWSAGQNCSNVARLLVTAPGTTRAFSVSQPMSVCAGRIQITRLGLDQGDD